MRADPLPVVIVGAGPAGLAVSAGLRRREVPFVVLERADAHGASWARHYDRLHLHTIKQLSALPYRGFGRRVPTYPSRDEVVEYLVDYARHFRIEPRFGVSVTGVRPRGDAWEVLTTDGVVPARAVVVTTGINRVPVVVDLPDRERFVGRVLHSSTFRSGRDFAGQRVVVVGIGNTGGEIAVDLVEHGASVTIAIRSPIHILPKTVLGIPTQLNALYGLGRLPAHLADPVADRIMRAKYGDLERYGVRLAMGGVKLRVQQERRVPLVDPGVVAHIRSGRIRVVPGAVAYTEAGLRTADGAETPADAVVLATGFRPALEELLAEAGPCLDPLGFPRLDPVGGQEEVPGIPGLHFVGFRTPLGGQLYNIRRESVRVAERLARTLLPAVR